MNIKVTCLFMILSITIFFWKTIIESLYKKKKKSVQNVILITKYIIKLYKSPPTPSTLS